MYSLIATILVSRYYFTLYQQKQHGSVFLNISNKVFSILNRIIYLLKIYIDKEIF